MKTKELSYFLIGTIKFNRERHLSLSVSHWAFFTVVLSFYEDLALGKNEIILIKNAIFSNKEKYLK